MKAAGSAGDAEMQTVSVALHAAFARYAANATNQSGIGDAQDARKRHVFAKGCLTKYLYAIPSVLIRLCRSWLHSRAEISCIRAYQTE